MGDQAANRAGHGVNSFRRGMIRPTASTEADLRFAEHLLPLRGDVDKSISADLVGKVETQNWDEKCRTKTSAPAERGAVLWKSCFRMGRDHHLVGELCEAGSLQIPSTGASRVHTY